MTVQVTTTSEATIRFVVVEADGSHGTIDLLDETMKHLVQDAARRCVSAASENEPAPVAEDGDSTPPLVPLGTLIVDPEVVVTVDGVAVDHQQLLSVLAATLVELVVVEARRMFPSPPSTT